MKNTIVEKEVTKVLESRWKKGRETYGVGISEDQHPDVLGWLNEAIEECADQLQYLVAMKVMLEKDKK
jgi:hypothetical protein